MSNCARKTDAVAGVRFVAVGCARRWSGRGLPRSPRMIWILALRFPGAQVWALTPLQPGVVFPVGGGVG